MESIVIRKLTKKFGDLVAVNEISFEVKKGEIFGFLGPNGAGKSTTLSMLATLSVPTSGKAVVNGFDVLDERDEVRKSIGMVFQDPTLDDELTALENLEMHGRLYGVPKDIRRKKSLDLLKLVDLEDRKDSLVKTFSGGMKRRLEIARGLLHEPKVLFLDEPTLGLDPQTRNKLWEYIRKLNEEKKITIILTTHYMDEADKLCNRIAIIDHGKIVTIDSSAKLKSSIGGQIMNIETKDKEKLVEALKSCKWCGEIKLHNGFVTVNVENAGKKIPDLVRLAEKNGIALGSISVSEPSLEDVFLHYTGRTIREQEATALDNLRKGRRMFGRR